MKIRFRITSPQLEQVKRLLETEMFPASLCGIGDNSENKEICLCVSQIYRNIEELSAKHNVVVFQSMKKQKDEMKTAMQIKKMFSQEDVLAVCYVGEESLRVVYAGEEGFQLVDVISVVGKKIDFYMDTEVSVEEMTRRTVQVFGTATVRMLKKMKIGVVGVSGTGSIVVEQLLRLGVGELVLVDDDIIEEKNLNRIINSKRSDAKEKKSKVDMVVDFVRVAELETKIIPCNTVVANKQTINELSQCDVLFGCLDSVDGRHHLNTISSAYLIPYFDVGVKLVADGIGGIDEVTTASHYIQPGSSSLFSRRVYDVEKLTAASLKRSNPDEYREQLNEKYIVGAQESSPAVISVNMLAASVIVLEFLSRIHLYRAEEMLNVEAIRMELINMRVVMQEETAACAIFEKYLGVGNNNPLMDL